MISYDPKYERILVYYTKIDYEDPRTYENNSDMETLETDSELKTYADLAHGYNVIAYRYAEKQADGSFEWNMDYDEGEGLPAEKGFTREGLYGQRFLNLAVQVDIQETEINRLENEGGALIGTEQVVSEAANPNTDPLVIGSDLISYNELALYAYVLDGDSSKSTPEDQELYLQIYNYELNTFHHPIKLTNNEGSDHNPKFIRTKGITYLYWISEGDIVYMDITDLVKNHLIKKEVRVNDVNRAIYIVDKSNTAIGGFVNKAIESKTDFPIEEFQIQSNGEEQVILFTDQALSYKNGVEAGSPQANDPENVNLERQMFAAGSKPYGEIREVTVMDAYNDTNTCSFDYAPGKGPGTYPAGITVTQSVYNDEGLLLFEAGTHAMDYSKLPDVNGYTGLVEAGDPVVRKQHGFSDGYAWSKPIQLTDEEGANYSDISFVVDNAANIHAVYIRYSQAIDPETGCFAPDTGNRTFAVAIFDGSSALKAGEVQLSDETPRGGENLRFSIEILNDGLKPVTGAQYKACLMQNGEVLEETGLQDISSADVIDEINGERIITQKNVLSGGNSTILHGEFLLPEDLTNTAVGFTVTDENGIQAVSAEKAVGYKATPEITVLDAKLTTADTAALSLSIQNAGNKDYAAGLEIAYASDGKAIKSTALQLGAGETKRVELNINIDPSRFGELQETENGSVYDELVLKAAAGEYTQNAVIRRVADKSIREDILNVTSFHVDESSVSLQQGTMKKLTAKILLNNPLPENTADPLEIVWTTSNKDVASVLPDGTVVGLAAGTAVITASLEPVRNTTISLPDGSFKRVQTSYSLPAGVVKKDSVVVRVGETFDDDEADEKENDKTDNPTDKGENTPESPQESGVVELKPHLTDQTGTIRPDQRTVSNALQTMRENNQPTLVFRILDESDIATSKLVLTKEIMKDIADSEVMEVAFETPGSKITLPKKALNSLYDVLFRDEEKKEISIRVRPRTNNYSGELQEMIGDRPVCEFSIFIGDTSIRELIDYPIPITLELGNLPEMEASINPNQMVGAYITDDGQYELIPLSGIKDDKFVIKTTHNSTYGMIHHDVRFHDNTGWSKDSVDFLSARGIVNGVGGQKFAPLQSITRAEFVKMMAALAGQQTVGSSITASSFTDVDPNKWYAPYIEWAYSNGLVNGVGHGLFAPDENITRQDMAVLLARLTEKLEYPLPVLKDEIAFVDQANISDYARNAVRSVQQAGILQGRPGLVFAPQANATREECASIFAALIRRMISE